MSAVVYLVLTACVAVGALGLAGLLLRLVAAPESIEVDRWEPPISGV